MPTCMSGCLEHYSYHEGYPLKARRLDTRYDKPGGCTYACRRVHANIKRMRKGQKRKKPCRTHQDKIIFDPISKGIAQRRNTQMKARKDNAKEKDKAHSCLAAYRQQKLKQKRTQKQRLSFLHSTREGAVTFFFSTLSL